MKKILGFLVVFTFIVSSVAMMQPSATAVSISSDSAQAADGHNSTATKQAAPPDQIAGSGELGVLGTSPIPYYACRMSCNNGDGCSYYSNAYTEWYPHTETHLSFTTLANPLPADEGKDGEYVKCYHQIQHSGHFGNCTTAVTGDTNVKTPSCILVRGITGQ